MTMLHKNERTSPCRRNSENTSSNVVCLKEVKRGIKRRVPQEWSQQQLDAEKLADSLNIPRYNDIPSRRHLYPAQPQKLPDALMGMPAAIHGWPAFIGMVAQKLLEASKDAFSADSLPVQCMVGKLRRGQTVTVHELARYTFFLDGNERPYFQLRCTGGEVEQMSAPIGIHRLLCWWAWGPPPPGKSLACHFACNERRCLNPRHLRWGSAQDNKKIERALVQYKKKTAFRRKVKGWHPGAWMLESDGF